MAEGITHANESLYKARSQFQRIQVTDPAQSDFYKPFQTIKDKAPGIGDKEAEALQQRAATVIRENVLPAFKRLQEYVFGDNYANLRLAPGVHSLPDGQNFYQERINHFTTLKAGLFFGPLTSL